MGAACRTERSRPLTIWIGCHQEDKHAVSMTVSEASPTPLIPTVPASHDPHRAARLSLVPGSSGIGPLPCPLPVAEGAGRRSGEGLWHSSKRRKANRSPAGPGPEFWDFENDQRALHDYVFWRKDVLPSAALPLRCGTFLFLREAGAPAEIDRLGWSLGFPGDFGKETDRNETCFFVQNPTGAAEKVRTEMTLGRAETRLTRW